MRRSAAVTTDGATSNGSSSSSTEREHHRPPMATIFSARAQGGPGAAGTGDSSPNDGDTSSRSAARAASARPEARCQRDLRRLFARRSASSCTPGRLLARAEEDVAIARGLMLAPSVLLLDEPFEGLAPSWSAADRRREEIKEMKIRS